MHKFSALLLTSLVAAFVLTAQADGPADNIPEKVRPAPRLPDWAGVDVNTALGSRWPGKVVEARVLWRTLGVGGKQPTSNT